MTCKIIEQLHKFDSNISKETNSKRNPWRECVLAAVLALSFGWVCVYTAMSTHTDAMRFEIYPALDSTYFTEKAGARIFAYLGVFYLWLAFVCYAAMQKGIQLPKPTLTMVRTYQVPWTNCTVSVIEAMAVFLFLVLLTATFVARVVNRFEFGYWPSERYVYEVAKTLGKTIALILMFILFPVSKKCFWCDMFNFQFERAIKFHRWLAWLLVWAVIIHAVIAIASLIMVDQFKNCMWPNEECEKPGGWENWEGLKTSRIFTYGWITFVIGIPLVITSLPWFRRNKFEWFYYTHFLFIVFLVMAHLHYDELIYYTAPGLAAYVLDKTLWWCSSRRRTKIVNLSSPAPGFCRITIAVDQSHTFEPGAWVQLKIPAISVLEWHPMSVASCPGHATITIDIKVLGDWTERLARLATCFDASRPSHTCVFVDNFYGSSHTKMQGYLGHPAVLMFSGGIGITPMISALRHLVEDSSRYAHIRKVVFVWICKKESVLELYRDELARLQSMKTTASGCEIEVIVHATLSEEEDDRNYTAIDVGDSTSTCCHHGPVEENTHYPFMQHPMGTRHRLILTICAGCGCLLGIFLANVFAHDNEWRPEWVSILQLFLAVLFSAVWVAFGMSAFWQRCGLPCPSRQASEETGSETQPDDSSFNNMHAGEAGELSVVLGCRPDVLTILLAMKDYCKANTISTAGVSVCGPEQLVRTVANTSREVSSSSSVNFVVDDETFDW